MKYRIALAVSLFALVPVVMPLPCVREKEQNILKEISYAEKHQNQNRIDGLNKAPELESGGARKTDYFCL